MFGVIEWASKEVSRQGDDALCVSDMMVAWGYALKMSEHNRVPTIEDAMLIAFLVKPNDNAFQVESNFRLVNVYFGSGNLPTRWENVPGATTRLFDMLGLFCNPMLDEELAQMVTKSLLEIHPWLDGNGRTAAIIYNWLRGTLACPAPLPEFDFSLEGSVTDCA